MTLPDDPGGGHKDRKGDGLVGYGRPPVNRQFKPGQSGNPRGRPKQQKNIATIVDDVLRKEIRIRRGNKVQSVTKLEAAIEVFLNKAVAGDHHAFAKLIQVLDKLGGFNLPPKEAIGSPGVVDYTEKLQQLIAGVIRSRKEEQMRAEAPEAGPTKEPDASHVGRNRARDPIGPNGTICADPDQNGAQSAVLLVEQRRSDKAERNAALSHKQT
jgi:hypothetical protein